MRLTGIAGNHHLGIKGHLGEQGNAGFLSQSGGTPLLEDGGRLTTVGTDKTAHILHQAHHWQLQFTTEAQGLFHIGQSNILGRGHHDGSGSISQQLHGT